VEAAFTPAASTPAAPEEFEIAAFEIPAAEAPTEAPAAKVPEPVKEAAKEETRPPVAPPPPPQPAKPIEIPVPEPAAEIDLAEEYELVLTPEPEPEAPPPAAKVNGSSALASDQFLADLADEIDKLGIGELTPSFSEPAAKDEAHLAPAAPVKEAEATSPLENEPLKEVFDEFRADLGEMGAEDEDLETHYNLGIAFREMGLLEEAISEFQKVAKANERGKAFRYAMQCCTLLGLAFMEKGQPSIAAIWYERALRTPGVDAESSLALRYDLGVAQESASDLDAALKSFSQVYAVNIDYRDVADRITALQKTTR
jgi:tetratricopeptide (TPR) repeat protein